MRWSQFFIPTTKETPKDATAPSHVLMLRAGLIRQLAAGVYTYLPLGYRTLRKVENIVREEMNRAGAIELHMPVLHPISLWNESGRTQTMGDVLLRLGGPEGDWRPNTVLGPTHEEIITEIARAYLKSYKQLPVNLYQIQIKMRGEARPKSGVLRTREFLMKDAYSFHADAETLDGPRIPEDVPTRIAASSAAAGLPYVAVEAESGAIGGDTVARVHGAHRRRRRPGRAQRRSATMRPISSGPRRRRCRQAPDEPLAAYIEEVHTPGARQGG